MVACEGELTAVASRPEHMKKITFLWFDSPTKDGWPVTAVDLPFKHSLGGCSVYPEYLPFSFLH